jgi:UDP-3-O-[3-hydroxymyristoyl] glucosamine N-acyltransferase
MRSSKLAELLGARLLGDDHELLALNAFYAAGERDLSILAWPKDIRLAKKRPVGALITSLDWAADYCDELASPVIAVNNIKDAFTKLNILITNNILFPKKLILSKEIAPSAIIKSSAQLGSARIGAKSQIDHGVVIEDQVIVGESCVIKSGVVLRSGTIVNNFVCIGNNTVIGSEAFAPCGEESVEDLPSLGHVEIAEAVRLGALCSIDRGLLGKTVIGRGSLLDNMIHVGHDVFIGENVVIAAQTGLAGFVQLANNVTIGGQVGIAPHVVIKSGARISGKSSVHRDIGESEIWSGNPSLPHAFYLRHQGALMREMQKNYEKKTRY